MELIADRIETGIEKYHKIMRWIHKTDVSADKEFQRLFNGYYRMRQRPASFYSCYYRFLEDNKNNPDLSFEDVLKYLYRETGSIQASFSSKLLATVRPEMPVWDKFVLQNLGLRAPYPYEQNRLEKTAAIYQRICDWYTTEEAAKQLAAFNEKFPEANLTDTKKIDFILWGTR